MRYLTLQAGGGGGGGSTCPVHLTPLTLILPGALFKPICEALKPNCNWLAAATVRFQSAGVTVILLLVC